MKIVVPVNWQISTLHVREKIVVRGIELHLVSFSQVLDCRLEVAMPERRPARFGQELPLIRVRGEDQFDAVVPSQIDQPLDVRKRYRDVFLPADRVGIESGVVVEY